MKRSGGLTVASVLLIVAGLLASWAALVPALVGPQLVQLGRIEEHVETFFSMATQGPRQLPPEQMEKLRTMFRRAMEDIRVHLADPAVRLSYLLAGLISLAACVAGVGMLMLNAWARRLAVWQAACAIPATAWSMALAWAFQQRLVGLASELVTDPVAQVQIQQVAQMARAAGFGSNLVVALAWNGTIIWFLSRASVKAQFQRAALTQSESAVARP